MPFPRCLLLVVCGLFSPGFRAGAQTEAETLVAGRATVGISFTITQTVGAYPLSPAKVESEAVKEIFYDGVMNPLDFDEEAEGFAYYSERLSEVRKRLGDGEVHPVERVTQVARKIFPQRYLTASFIKDLIARAACWPSRPAMRRRGRATAWWR